MHVCPRVVIRTHVCVGMYDVHCTCVYVSMNVSARARMFGSMCVRENMYVMPCMDAW